MHIGLVYALYGTVRGDYQIWLNSTSKLNRIVTNHRNDRLMYAEIAARRGKPTAANRMFENRCALAQLKMFYSNILIVFVF